MADEQVFNFLAPLDQACAKDELRPAMECVYFKNGHAYASNGHVLIKQSLTEYCTVVNKELLEDKCLHRDSFKNIRDFDVADAQDDGINCYDHDNGKKAFFPYSNQISPNFETVINGVQATNIPFIGMNPKNVEIASKCLVKSKDTALRFSFHGLDKPIIVTAEGYESQHAVIMPMILGGNLF